MSFLSLSKIETPHALARLVMDYWCDTENPKEKSTIHFRVHTYFMNAVDRLFDIETHISDEEFDSSDLTCSLDKGQRAAINRVPYSMKTIVYVARRLQSDTEIARMMAAAPGDFSDWLDLALIAYIKTRQVSAAQIASLGLLLGARNQLIYDRRVNFLYPGDPPSNCIFPMPASAPRPELRTYRIDQNHKYVQRFFNFSDQEMQPCLERLKRKPLSEQYYTTIGMPIGDASLLSQGHRRLMDSLGFLKPVEEGVYPLFKDSKHTVMVVPSFSMLQECVRHHFPQDAVPMVPLLGRCDKAEITKYTLQGRCVFHLGTSRARAPFEADNNFFGEYSYSLHDLYHLLRKAMMGSAGQRAVCYLIGCVLANNRNGATEEIRWKLTDGQLHARQELFGALFSCGSVPWDDLHVGEVVKNMATIPDLWENDFGITPDQLRPKERQLYDALLPKITEEERTQAKVDAFHYFQRFTHPTNRAANFRLAWMYFSGYGTESSYVLAKRHFELAGKLGYVMLAIQYRDGLGCERNPLQALHYFELAAENGNGSAINQLGRWHFLGYEGVVSQHYGKALHYFEQAAAKTDPSALRSLGVMHAEGHGVRKDPKKGFTYFKQAADLGDEFAHLRLGFLYFEGCGTERSYALAKKHFELAGKLGYIMLATQYRDGLGCERDPRQALHYLELAAENGDCDAINQLGAWYSSGYEDVVTQHYGKALHYFEQAAAKKDPCALRSLGVMHAQGHWVKKDPKTSFTYFKQAADLGDVLAQLQLGSWYKLANKEADVPEDGTLALSYFFKAAEQGNAAAYCQLGMAFRDGRGCEKHVQTAFMYFLAAAVQGNAGAQNELGAWYFKGVEGVVEKNLERAEYYFKLAAQQGHEKAAHNLNVVESLR